MLREMYDKKEMSPSALADLIGMTRGAASKLIDRLVVKKLVSGHERTDDRRFQDIKLTAAGRRLVPAIAAIADQNDEEFFAVLSKREHAALVAALKKLVRVRDLHQIPAE